MVDLPMIIKAANPQATGEVSHVIKTALISGNLDIKSIYTSDIVYNSIDFPYDIKFKNNKLKT